MKKLIPFLFVLALPAMAQTSGGLRLVNVLAQSCTSNVSDGSNCSGYERTWCVKDSDNKGYRCSPSTHQWTKFAELDTSNVPTLVATATALAANGANCSPGSAPRGVDAQGASESCTAFQPSDADLDDMAALNKCSNGQIPKSNGTAWACSADSTGGTPSFDTIASGSNTAAAMVLGNGSSLGTSGTGTNTANALVCGTACVDMASEIGTFDSSAIIGRCNDETGTGLMVFATAPTLTNPVVGTQAANDSSTKAASTAYVQAELTALASDTYTETNKTFDAEGAGNTLSIPMKLWLPAAGCQASTAASFWDNLTANPAVAACVTGTNTQKGVLDFDATTNQFAQATVLLPGDWVGTSDVKFKWLAAATSGNVIWGIQTSCVADAETDDPSWNTASTVTDGAKGTTLQTNDASITGMITTGCAAGELMHVNIYRDAASGSDTMTGNARLIGVELTLRRSI